MKSKLVKVYRGPMFSGKSARLVEEYGDGVGIMAFRPQIDNRYGTGKRIYSKTGASAVATFVDHRRPLEILRRALLASSLKKIIIDEISFFPTEDFLTLVSSLTELGLEVVLGGLDYDAQQIEWGPALSLVRAKGVTDIVLTARCDGDRGECRTPAVWSYRKVPSGKRLVVEGEAMYGATCDTHYPLLHHKP